MKRVVCAALVASLFFGGAQALAMSKAPNPGDESPGGGIGDGSPVDPIDPIGPPDPVDPIDPVDPVDPEEPKDPKPDPIPPSYPPGSCGPKSELPECFEPAVTYKPDLPQLGQYNDNRYCKANYNWQTDERVYLQNNEPLQKAYDRLYEKTNGAGGMIVVQAHIDTVQCDSLYIKRSKFMPKLSLRGRLGPNGEMPRFYCRAAKRDGTVTHGFGSHFLSLNSGKSNPVNASVLIENLHIDGYGTAILAANSGKTVIRNNYIHHQVKDGITVNGIDDSYAPGFRAYLEICGNEIAHSGEGNSRHGLYLHRSRRDDKRGEIAVKLVDNLLHSCAGSSCFKSTANRNLVKGNRIISTRYTDPSYSKRYSQMLVDVVACANNEVLNNYLHRERPDPSVVKKGAGGPFIGVRNRKGIFGCDAPTGYVQPGRQGVVHKITGSDFWKAGYWQALGRQIILKTRVENNTMEVEGFDANKQSAVTDYGTYPNYAAYKFGPECLLEPPIDWYERHRTYVKNNTYKGFNQEKLYASVPPGSKFELPKECPNIPHPDLREFNLIVNQGGEKVL